MRRVALCKQVFVFVAGPLSCNVVDRLVPARELDRFVGVMMDGVGCLVWMAKKAP